MAKRTIVVTGGASGIGAATAQLFAERGDCVYVLDIKSSNHLAHSENIKHIHCDVSDFKSVQSAV